MHYTTYIVYTLLGLLSIPTGWSILTWYLVKRSQEVFDEKLQVLTDKATICFQPTDFMRLYTKLENLQRKAEGEKQLRACAELTGYLNGRWEAYHPVEKKVNWKSFLTKELPVLSN